MRRSNVVFVTVAVFVGLGSVRRSDVLIMNIDQA